MKTALISICIPINSHGNIQVKLSVKNKTTKNKTGIHKHQESVPGPPSLSLQHTHELEVKKNKHRSDIA